MSTKWRRSKKHLKWLSLNNFKEKKNNLNITRSRMLNNPKKAIPPNYRSSEYYGRKKWKFPTPLIDVFQEKNYITIIVELAGFNKDNFKIDVKDQKLILSATENNRRYYKSLNLPKVVIPNEISTKHNNGILQIKLRKAKKNESY